MIICHSPVVRKVACNIKRNAHTFRWTLRTIRELPAAWTGHALPDIPSGNSLRRDGADDHRRSIGKIFGLDIERHHSALGRVGGRACPSSREIPLREGVLSPTGVAVPAARTAYGGH